MSDPAILILVLLVAFAASWILTPDLWARAYLDLGRRRAGLRPHCIEVENIRWYYLKGGQGPTLLMLHGFGGDSSNWLQISRLLRQRFSLVIPDLPGFGASEPPDALPFDMESQARRLEAFLDTIGVRTCLVAGNSMGGYLACAMAARSPQRVSGLWLLAPLGVRATDPGEVLSRADSGDIASLQIDSTRQYRRRVLANMFARQRWLPGPLVKFLARRAIAMRHQVPRMLQEVRFDSEPLESIARRVVVPVLVQWGAQDKVTNPQGLDVLKVSFDESEGNLTPDCGHLPMLELPERSAELFLDFVARKALE